VRRDGKTKWRRNGRSIEIAFCIQKNVKGFGGQDPTGTTPRLGAPDSRIPGPSVQCGVPVLWQRSNCFSVPDHGDAGYMKMYLPSCVSDTAP
jgi:hypothetical protein